MPAFDLVLRYGIGLLGVVMRGFDFPTAPVAAGMILGPRRKCAMRCRSAKGTGASSCSAVLVASIVAVLLLPRLMR